MTGLGYGSGVYYSLINDNFHDFFTKYVPFADDAVSYLEERQLKQRFPNSSNRLGGTPRQTGDKVTIPSGSGITWRVVEEDNKSPADPKREAGHRDSTTIVPEEARHKPVKDNAVDKVKEAKKAEQETSSAALKPSTVDDMPKPETGPTTVKPTPPQKPVQDETKPVLKHEPAQEAANVAPQTLPVGLLAVSDTEEPAVKDFVQILNNIITIINAGHASSRLSSAIESAKSELSQLGSRIRAAKEKLVEQKMKATHEEFDQAAKELVRRLEDQMHDQEARWQDEFEAEREKISQSYHEKLRTELDRAKEVQEQRLRNELLEQALELKRKFIAEVKDRVEEERNGRLGKLSELSGSVKDLEQLSTGWNEVVDSNLKTQRLHVAVEAVRANLESAAQPRPFVRELAALKETASDDPVVNAAIASISPGGYQRGLPSSAQLIDRFRRVASEVRKASLVPDHAGVASHAASLLLSKVLFKKQGVAVGDDVESVLSRAETFLEEGNLDGAAREMNGLTGWAKTLSKDWLSEVRKVLEVHQALDVRLMFLA